jgi:hypothetical protein
MAQATDSLATAHTTCNTTDPVQALATCWSTIHEIDRAQRELDQGEKAAHEQKDCLEQAVLALEPQSADEALSVLLVAADELRHVQHVGVLQGVLRWLVSNGATSPLLPVYADGRLHPKQSSVKP